MAENLAGVQRDLAKLQRRPLSIIKLSDPILSGAPPRRVSNDPSGSDTHEPAPSPASLSSDLIHYRELFKKLHFSYLEQVSKEKFLRAIVGDPPEVVEPSENADLERKLTDDKAILKASKEDVAGLVADLEAQGRELAARYENVQIQTTQLNELPAEIARLEGSIEELEAAQRERTGADAGVDSRMTLPLPQTTDLLNAKREEIDKLDREIAALRQSVPQKAKQVERLEAELRPLENQRNGAAGAAEEARRRKEMREGGMSDEVELKGRWYTGAKEVLGDVLGTGAK